ncbi:hypothetical protein E4U27_000266 [Claviceps purpurea]|nr:hypothetical protein E4U27_000266 [Claviceps purpurea]
MSSQNTNSSVILHDQNQWTAWFKFIKARAKTLKIWEKIEPGSQLPLLEEPTEPEVPSVSGHEAFAGVDEPADTLQLTANGLKSYDREMVRYKSLLDAYKLKQHKYEKEATAIDTITQLVQSTVATHLQHSCCNPDDTLQQWITNLRRRVGIDEQVEQENARRRYLAALRPMRAPNQWDTWLTEYDQAAGHAEAVGVPDLLSFRMVSLDFGDAVAQVAKNWVPGFMDNGRYEPNMDRREMMKRFRGHMTRYYPLDKKSRAGVFVTADDQSILADGGASTQSRKRDASASTNSAPVPKRPKRKNDVKATAGRKSTAITKSTTRENVRCPACSYHHELKNCFYVNKERAPEWFRFDESLSSFIEKRKEVDTDFRQLLQEAENSTNRSHEEDQ